MLRIRARVEGGAPSGAAASEGAPGARGGAQAAREEEAPGPGSHAGLPLVVGGVLETLFFTGI